ncbi:hypothetical protein [Xylophilus sp. GOD-11R]|uniref:hypothetical protein n=1 Tax=Xylophilus sp. GOD-11R TaxID=3089814 RepID=UPI00298C6F7B|nr:hypothetical protein [Xylophilus sp. GOD-11R]WPB58951.1 hypothetical protein R9X41_10075 [Xylophilus sp. GOD-11R]
MTVELRALIDAELKREAPPAVAALARRLAARARGGAAAVLYYGSSLRTGDLDGVLDFYILVDRVSDWPASRFAAAANRVLPPNVGYLDQSAQAAGQNGLRAKYAVMSVAQFRRAMSVERIDTTLWARFSQPCQCVHARDARSFEAMRDAVCDAVVAASQWAARLGPASADGATFWRRLYQRTYAAEVRVERAGRANDLLAGEETRYCRLLPLAWQAGGIAFVPQPDGRLEPKLSASERAHAEAAWQRRQRLGRPLNLARLLKAALTFDNATDYVAWKVERHSGYRIEPTEFQRRHPLLAAPAIYWRLRRRGVLR